MFLFSQHRVTAEMKMCGFGLYSRETVQNRADLRNNERNLASSHKRDQKGPWQVLCLCSYATVSLY